MVRVTSNAPEGTPCWVDLGVPDIETAKRFYGNLFGWEFSDNGPETGHYHSVLLHGAQVAGMMPMPDDQAGGAVWWGMYFATDDCDGVVKRVTDARGQIVNAPMDVMDLGRMAILEDPQGGRFGLWQGRTHIGSEIVNEPGSFSWNDLVTPDGDDARRFYTAVFHYDVEPVPGDMDYTVLKRADGHYIGGLLGMPGVPAPAWNTYFEVDDTDAAVRRVREGGGSVDEEPEDTPYGRIAAVRDPFGAAFRLVKSVPPSETGGS